MFARVSTYQESPERLDEAIRVANEQVLRRARQMDGFKAR